MMWLVTACTVCPSRGLAPCESASVARVMVPVLGLRCPDCGGGPRSVRGPFDTDELPPGALDALPPNWREYFPAGL
jgi:hypothetical protein